ncbi:MAG TPA: AlpA family phage regulatory protein [Actinomycetota bacterium]|jgi:predicted DNA-binding transcriptional regulator AlpA
MTQEADGSTYSLRQIAEHLGVTPQRVHQLRGRPDFPKPVAVGLREAAWSRTDIERWAETYPCGHRRWGRAEDHGA